MPFLPEHPSRRQVALFLLAATISLTIPSLLPVSWGVLFALIAPIPISLACLLTGCAWALVVAALSGLAVALVSGVKSAVFFTLETALLGLAVGFGQKRRLPLVQVNVLAAGLVLAGHLTAVMVSGPGSLQGNAEAFRREIDRSRELVSEYLGKETKGEVPLKTDLFQEVLATFLPGMFVTGAFMNCLFCALMSARLAMRFGYGEFARFVDWKVPDQAVWLFIALGFAVAWDYHILFGVPAAGLLALSFLYVVQGAAISLTWADRKGIAPWLKFVIAVVVLIQPFFLAVFLVLGLLDFRFDFRKPRPPAPA